MTWQKKRRARTALLTLSGLIITLQVALLLAALHHEGEDIALPRFAEACRSTLQQLQRAPQQHPQQHHQHRQESDDNGNCAIRAWYLEQLRVIPDLTAQIQAEGGSVADQALCAFGVRHQARLSARDMMSSTFQVALLRARDFYVYGHFDGPEFDQLIGEHPARSDYEQVISEAIVTNEQVNTQCQLDVNAAPAGALPE